MTRNVRKTYIDVLKGIGIFYVVFGHITHIEIIKDYIWNFHMPLFFLVSGFLFEPVKYGNFRNFVKSAFKSIYIPYVIFFFATILYWLLIERKVRGGEYSILHQLFGLFYGTYEGNHLYFNGALWFLPCLFSVELIFYFISKSKNKVEILTLLILSFCIGTIIRKTGLNVLPLGLHTAFFALIFYGIGFLSKPVESQFVNLSIVYKIIILAACLLVQFLTLQAGYVSTIEQTPIYYIPVALVGIIFYFSLSELIRKNKILEYLGQNSLVILAFQEPMYRAIIKVFCIICHLDIEVLRKNLVYCILISIVCLLLNIPIIYTYNTYVRKRILNVHL